MNNPFFSLILPIYNVDRYLERCINSILEEEFTEYEVILVDDGSTDRSPAICDRYAQKYDNIFVIHKSNGGLSSARNAGLQVAKGNYIFWIDSDDWIERGALERIYNVAEKYSSDIIKFNYKANPSGEESLSVLEPGLYNKQEIQNSVVTSALINTSSINFSVWSHVYKYSFLIHNGLEFVSERLICSEDYLFNFQAYLLASTIYAMKDINYIYDFRDGSLSRTFKPQMSEQYRNLNNMIIEFADRQGLYYNLKDTISYSYVNRCFCILMRNECFLYNGHSFAKAYFDCRRIVRTEEFVAAIRDYPWRDVNWKDKLIFGSMKLGLVLFPMILLMRGIKRHERNE